MRYLNTNVLSAVDTASANGSQIDSNQLLQASFQAFFGDATAAGSVKVQASNDICHAGYLPMDFIATNWSDIPGATVTVVAGATVLIPLTLLSYRWIRAVFTRTGGGSSTVTVNMMAQGV